MAAIGIISRLQRYKIDENREHEFLKICIFRNRKMHQTAEISYRRVIFIACVLLPQRDIMPAEHMVMMAVAIKNVYRALFPAFQILESMPEGLMTRVTRSRRERMMMKAAAVMPSPAAGTVPSRNDGAHIP